MNDFNSLTHRGNVSNAAGRRDEARAFFESAVIAAPDSAVGHINLANILREDEPDTALAHYRAALRIDPDSTAAHLGLSALLALGGDEGAARYHRNRALEGHPFLHLPYRGNGQAIPALAVASSVGGNVTIPQLLDDRIFATTVLFVEAYDPATALPSHSIALNAIAEADRFEPELRIAQSILARTNAPTINQPAAVLLSGRASNAERMRSIPGAIVPHVRTIARDAFDPEGWSFPLLLRAPGHHRGRHFLKVDRAEDLAGAIAQLPGPSLLAIEYLDARGTDTNARKYRAMVVGGRLYPLHLAISTNWNVHYFSADMADRHEHRREEERYLRDMSGTLGSRALHALETIAARLELDYAGVDFGVDAGGNLLFFEANAGMTIVIPDDDERWNYRRRATAIVFDAIRRMATGL